jgi:N-acetyl-gamma-glutamyl-phosphate reductase
VAFLCLPDAALARGGALVTNPRTCLIDASTAFRTQPDWVFGLPELAPGQRDRIRQTKRIANPGCHASAFILLLRPLVDAGLVPRTLPVSALSITGYSGGGKKMIEQYQSLSAEPALTSPRPYGLTLAHKHVPEMMAHTGLTCAADPDAGGQRTSTRAWPCRCRCTCRSCRPQPRRGGAAGLERHYAGERFVRVMPLRDADTLEQRLLRRAGLQRQQPCRPLRVRQRLSCC